jgi:hypothetical protein
LRRRKISWVSSSKSLNRVFFYSNLEKHDDEGYYILVYLTLNAQDYSFHSCCKVILEWIHSAHDQRLCKNK